MTDTSDGDRSTEPGVPWVTSGPRGGPFASRPVPVVDDLDDLRGPTTGIHQLPLHLDASARAHYDLSEDWASRRLLTTVLIEAATTADLTAWVDRDTLLAQWRTLFLPPYVRRAWQTRHSALAELGSDAGVPA